MVLMKIPVSVSVFGYARAVDAGALTVDLTVSINPTLVGCTS